MTNFLKKLAEHFFALLFQFYIIGVFAGFAIGGGYMIWGIINLFR